MHDDAVHHPAWIPELIEALRGTSEGEAVAETLELRLRQAPSFELPWTPTDELDYLKALFEVFGPGDEDHAVCESVFWDRWDAFGAGMELADAIAVYRAPATERTSKGEGRA